MRSRIDLPDLAFGLFLIALGATALIATADLSIGRAGDMGPGYVPRWLALAIALFGVALAVRAVLARRVALPAVELRPLLLISAALGLFALLLPTAGLAIASVATIVCAGFAASDTRPVENILFAVAMTAFAIALFVVALGMPVAIWPW
jgi:hypothetical protein